MRDHGGEDVRWRNEIGVEDREQIAAALREARGQRACFESVTLRAPQMTDPHAASAELRDFLRDDRSGLVGRVVEDLDVEQAGIRNLAHGIEQTTGDIRLVEQRQLNGHRRPPEIGWQFAREGRSGAPPKRDEIEPMRAVDRQCAECQIVDGENGDRKGGHGRDAAVILPSPTTLTGHWSTRVRAKA